jgi:large subunit ribosomal protein L6
MSRVAKNPIVLPPDAEVSLQAQLFKVTGAKGSLEHPIPKLVEVSWQDNTLTVAPSNQSVQADALAGTTRAIIYNLVHGVTQGFEKRLILVGVGYRAQVQDNILNLNLGFSHPLNFNIPPGITIESPSQTEIVVKGVDKQQVGQVAAKIRSFRPPEPYKGKGIKYSNEVIIRKEAKKK